jgi:UDP-glucose 4-epimerase
MNINEIVFSFTFAYFAYSYTMTIKYHTALSIFRAYYASVYVLGWIIKVSKQVRVLFQLAKRSANVICAKNELDNGKVQNKIHDECSVQGIRALFMCNAVLNLDLRNYSTMC